MRTKLFIIVAVFSTNEQVCVYHKQHIPVIKNLNFSLPFNEFIVSVPWEIQFIFSFLNFVEYIYISSFFSKFR